MKKDYIKTEPLVVTSVRLPKWLLDKAKKKNINISLLLREALLNEVNN